VLDEGGTTIGLLDLRAVDRLIGGGTATAGMVAKLRACQDAVRSGVGDALVVDGRDAAALSRMLDPDPPGATRIVRAGPAGGEPVEARAGGAAERD
jgi:acetylglutamate kinase